MTSADESQMEPMAAQRRFYLLFCVTVLIGVLLCAVYLVGRSAWVTPQPAAKTDSPIQNHVANSAADNPPPAVEAPASPALAVDAPPIEPKPVHPDPMPAASEARSDELTPTQPDPAPALSAARSEEVKPAQTDPPPAAPVSRSDKPLPSDTYLQMAAVERGMAEVFVEVLRRKGLPAKIAKGPTAEIFRVLVGPVKDAESLARIKADLQAAGFSSFARRYRGE